MKRKPLPKAITRSIANLRGIATGFAADEQGRVPRHVERDAAAFDAVEPEPRPGISHKSMDQAPRSSATTLPESKSRATDPLPARRRALAHKIVERHKNYAAFGGLMPLPAANIANLISVNLRMVKRLSALYGVPYQRDRTRALIIALIAGAVPPGAGVSSTLMWIVPGGLVWGLGVSAITARALTRGIGLVFVESFENAIAD
jgi:uncharacterized protein (DUF697 family)